MENWDKKEERWDLRRERRVKRWSGGDMRRKTAPRESKPVMRVCLIGFFSGFYVCGGEAKRLGASHPSSPFPSSLLSSPILFLFVKR